MIHMQVQQNMLKLLHVGCGLRNPSRLPGFFRSPQWKEIRLDIDPAVEPDIVGNIINLAPIADMTVDAIWSSHNLEHLNSHEVPMALAEFRRILKPDGFALISVPDLRAIARHIVDDQLTDMLYQSAAGPITPLDVVFGHQASIKNGNEFMGHRTGFTATTLGQLLCEAGFEEVRIHEGDRWDLWAIATLTKTRRDLLAQLADVMQ
jgi:predicted SAM-dependent methyltransferase